MRVGVVNYVNSRPLSRGLLSGGEAGVECELLPPAVIADRLRDGSLDVGLVPSIELARNPDLVVVPGLAIAATHEVRSVLLVSQVPVEKIRRVALDENSRTSAVLVRLVLAERYGITPEYTPARADLATMLGQADAALLIGDPALAVDPREGVVLDLAGEWLELTGLPFVFAVWAARRPVADRVRPEIFAASFESGWAQLDAIVAETAVETGLTEVVLRDYFTRNLRFVLGASEQAGLAEYLRRAGHAGLAPAAAPLRFLTAAASTVD